MSGIFIVGAKRTPFGAFGGLLKNLSATELGVLSTKAALAEAGLTDAIGKHDDAAVIFGNVISSSPDAPYVARHVALQAGCALSTASLTINRLCGSGFETVVQGSNLIQLNQASIAICGGTENMSNAPLQVSGNDARWGTPLGKGLSLRDSLWDGLTDLHIKTPMGITAENLAQKYDITRQECDEFAIRSQTTYARAHEEGVFDAEIAPVEVKTRKGMETVTKDEHPRETTVEKVGKLKPVFIKKTGVVTAANASGICDGAGTIILASEEAVKQYNLTPLARLLSFGTVGCDPKIMGIGPVPAIQQALARANLTVKDVDRLEINEAFAAQFLACMKELEKEDASLMERTNLHGGAIALGHPLAASGSRIVAHLVQEYAFSKNTDSKYHVGAACIGGGQGIAVVLERV